MTKEIKDKWEWSVVWSILVSHRYHSDAMGSRAPSRSVCLLSVVYKQFTYGPNSLTVLRRVSQDHKVENRPKWGTYLWCLHLEIDLVRDWRDLRRRKDRKQAGPHFWFNLWYSHTGFYRNGVYTTTNPNPLSDDRREKLILSTLVSGRS